MLVSLLLFRLANILKTILVQKFNGFGSHFHWSMIFYKYWRSEICHSANHGPTLIVVVSDFWTIVWETWSCCRRWVSCYGSVVMFCKFLAGKCLLREYSIAFHEFAQMLRSGTTSQGSELAELNYSALLLPEEPTPQFNYIPTPWSQVTTCTRRLERSTFEIRLGGSGSLGTGTAD